MGSVPHAMRDLPITTEQGKYSLQQLSLFDEHRSAFRRSVELFDRCDIRDQLPEGAEDRMHPDVRIEGFERRIMCILAGGKSVRHLEKVAISGTRCTPLSSNFSGHADLITAIYLPVGLDWVVVEENHLLLAHTHNQSPPLEEILGQCRSLPYVMAGPLEDILGLVRKARVGYVHRQEETIVMDGDEYRRWVFVEPYFPVIGFRLALRVPHPTTVYIEGVVLDVGERNLMLDADHTLFATGDTPNLITINNGCLQTTSQDIGPIAIDIPGLGAPKIPGPDAPSRPPKTTYVYTSLF